MILDFIKEKKTILIIFAIVLGLGGFYIYTSNNSDYEIIDSNNRIEKVNTKLNKFNKLNLNIEGNNFLSNIKTAISKNIVLSKEDDNLLKNWINRGNIKLSLIYKATVDSDFSNAFHSKCDDHAPTITIIKTDQGIRFGGYTTKTWNCKEECKKDDNAFLFSLEYILLIDNFL